MHTTNSTDVLITPSPDTTAEASTPPPTGRGTVAEMQYERLAGHDYEWTSDELLFDVHCTRRGIPAAERQAEQEAFFSTGIPCLRASPLTKTYGWGVHHDSRGRIALVPTGSARMAELEADDAITVRPAMRSRRAT